MRKSILFSAVVFLLLSVYCINPKKHKTDGDNDLNTEQRLKTASKEYLKSWSDKDTAAIQALSVSNMERNVNGKIVSNNPSGLRESLKFWHTAIPDFKTMASEIMIKDNRAYISWTCTGTHTGKLGEVPPTGKKSITEGFSILTFDERGKIVRENAYYDLLGAMQEWGYTVVAPVME